MVGMIFAAGYGTRLKPWTDSHPKALVPVDGVPALERVVDKMLALGINRIVVNTHHFAGQISDFVASRPWAQRVIISHEPILLDTGGGLRKALQFIGDEPVLIHNADIMTDLDLAGMAEAHRTSGADATLLTGIRATSRFLLFNPGGHLAGYYRTDGARIMPADIPAADRGDMTGRCFDGVHIVSPTLYRALRDFAPDDTPFSIINFYRTVAANAAIRAYDMPAGRHWFDIGTPEKLAAARDFLTTRHD